MFYVKAWRIGAAVSRFFSPSHCKQVEEREKRQSRPKNEMRARSNVRMVFACIGAERRLHLFKY
jgi:hypothetical protein